MRENKDKFYQKLEEVFVGAKFEGEGGFIKLLNIKSKYYETIKDKLEGEVMKFVKDGTQESEDMYAKLYSFFNRYFSPNGSLYFTDTAIHNNTYTKIYKNKTQTGLEPDALRTAKSIDNEGYEKIYAAKDDVVLFWKTQNLYYVKTDNLFRNIKVTPDVSTFAFDASRLENKQTNKKKELHFSLVDVVEDEIKIKVSWQEGNGKTDAKGIAKKLKQQGIPVSEKDVEKAFWYFKQQTKCDFFINKNAKAFLQEQFKIWCANYLWESGGEWSSERVNEIQNLKDIAFKLIDFFSQFEDELISIWNKPKFARNSNYVISVDRIDEEILKKIREHKGYKEQLKEWDNLGINKDNATAPIDTKFFKDIEADIISEIKNLDEALDGRLIKSESYQALNTILPKFKKKVQCIYIDPPFNLGVSANYEYEVNYKDASWASLLENRIYLAKDILTTSGAIFVRCDVNGNWIVRPILSAIFGEDNFLNEIILNRTQEFFKSPSKLQKKLMNDVDSLLSAANSEETRLKLITVPREYNNEKDGWLEPFLPSDNISEDTRVLNGEEITAPKGRKWGLKQEDIDKLAKIDYIKKEGDKVRYRPIHTKIKNNWTDIPGYSRTHGFKTENSEELLYRTIYTSTEEGDLVCDFFLGSGTTAAVAHKMGRKWIGIEMGEHFDTVVLPRMKKVLAYDKTGISKNTPKYKGGGFFKYYDLEQYEEVLAKCQMAEMGDDLITHTNKSDYEQYVFLTNTKLTECIEIDLKKKKYKVDLSKLYENIDVAETISNESGRWIKSIDKDKVEFFDGHSIDLKNLDYKEIKDLIWWERHKR